MSDLVPQTGSFIMKQCFCLFSTILQSYGALYKIQRSIINNRTKTKEKKRILWYREIISIRDELSFELALEGRRCNSHKKHSATFPQWGVLKPSFTVRGTVGKVTSVGEQKPHASFRPISFVSRALFCTRFFRSLLCPCACLSPACQLDVLEELSVTT